jgi:hypothetical protein
MHRHVLAMSDEQRNYKGIEDNAAGLLVWLEQHGTE